MLREYFELEEIPPRLWLPLALRSLRGNSVRAWSVAITDTLTSYSEFEKAFHGQFWDDISQNRVRCRLYQEKYDGSKAVSMADHCLKFAVFAKFLRPPMNETEILAALKCHFEPYVQHVCLTAPIKTVQDAVSLLKQIEAIGDQPVSRPLGQSNSGPPYKRENQFHSSPPRFSQQHKQESYRGHNRNYHAQHVNWSRGPHEQWNRSRRWRDPPPRDANEADFQGGKSRLAEGLVTHRQTNQPERLDPLAPPFNTQPQRHNGASCSNTRTPEGRPSQH
jgi:hypothetical protein